MPPPPAALLVPDLGLAPGGVGIDRQRAIRAAATVAPRLEECGDLTPARRWPGCGWCRIGVWTAAETAQRALGDADAVSVGDFHIPGLVGHFLIGGASTTTGCWSCWPSTRRTGTGWSG